MLLMLPLMLNMVLNPLLNFPRMPNHLNLFLDLHLPQMLYMLKALLDWPQLPNLQRLQLLHILMMRQETRALSK